VCDLAFFFLRLYISFSVSFCFVASVLSEASSRVREREYTCMHICTRTFVLYTLLIHTHTHTNTNSCTVHSTSTHLHTGHRQTQEPLAHHQKRFFFPLFFDTQGIAKLKNLSRTIKNFSLATGVSHSSHGTSSSAHCSSECAPTSATSLRGCHVAAAALPPDDEVLHDVCKYMYMYMYPKRLSLSLSRARFLSRSDCV
jgi:hypothetical protein